MHLPSPRQYPSKVIVGDHEWELKFVRRIGESRETCGECDPSTQTIRIKQKQSHADTFYTFIHEIIHAMEEEYSIKLNHKVVYKLERAIGDFLIVNDFNLKE